MPCKRYTVEQAIAKLREIEKFQGQGMSIPRAAKRVGIADQTFTR
jgi:transposase